MLPRFRGGVVPDHGNIDERWFHVVLFVLYVSLVVLVVKVTLVVMSSYLGMI